MRALQMARPGGAEHTTVQNIAVPEPGPGELTIDVSHAGVNFVDVMARRGDAGYVPAWPYRPGKEVAGTVRALGPGVTGFAIGDRVAAATVDGGFAEVAVASTAATVPVPEGVPSVQAAAVPLGLATALLLLTDAGRFEPGDTVLVHSAGGGIGGALARLVPLLGSGTLIGTVGRPDRVAAAQQAGYPLAFARSTDLAEQIRTATGGRGVDLVLDPLGTRTLDLDLEVTAPGGRVVLFGNADGGPLDALPPVGRLLGGNLTVTGFSHRGLLAAAPARVARAQQRALDLLAEGKLDAPVVELDSLEDVAAAHDLLAAGRGAGKYVVRVTG
ncbi:quinone oxidoreductase family protein [Kitasatospora sp. McL0602]|uniref:quinone oxidoreductase family protein n=1 Tax=Kitasatospora sp. McL0602 TaxID=3439530 RepID=UPI003F8BFF86